MTPEAKVLAQLQRRFALNTGLGAGLVALGAGVILLETAVVSAIIAFIFWNFFDGSFIGWGGWFFVVLLGFIPLLLKQEKQSQGGAYGEFGSGLSNPMEADSYAEYEMASAEAAGAAYMELLLFGPRTFIQGLSILRGQEPSRLGSLLQRAATVIVTLLRAHDAMPLKKLAIPGEPPEQFRAVMRWLDRHDYIGISTDGTRAWLNSRIREKLNAERILSS